MTYIHILKGTGSNCTCYDCVVLYGGKCATTKDNNFLDHLEKKVLKYLTKTPTGKPRKISDSYMDKCIEEVVRPEVSKYLKIKRNLFDRQYYSFMPLLFIMTSQNKEATKWYKRARNWEFDLIRDKINS